MPSEATGSPSGERRDTVICLHSSASSPRQWQSLGERLPARYRVICPGLIGYSDAPLWSGDRPVSLDEERVGCGPSFDMFSQASGVGHGDANLQRGCRHSTTAPVLDLHSEQNLPTLRPLPRSFYARPVLSVARSAIGKILVHDSSEGRVSGRIVETEAYRGPLDRAAHSFGGRRTARTDAMFGPPGHAYLFFVYGMHWHLNLVTTAIGAPEAVLLRAVEPLEGVELMARRRGIAPGRRELTNGPGKLCEAFGIDGSFYGADLTSGALYLADGPTPRVARAKRIGVDYAGAWAAKLWRFYDPASAFVSRRAR